MCDDIKVYLVSGLGDDAMRFGVVIAATTLLEVRAGCVMRETSLDRVTSSQQRSVAFVIINRLVED